jgi:hypothetical protein
VRERAPKRKGPAPTDLSAISDAMHGFAGEDGADSTAAQASAGPNLNGKNGKVTKGQGEMVGPGSVKSAPWTGVPGQQLQPQQRVSQDQGSMVGMGGIAGDMQPSVPASGPAVGGASGQGAGGLPMGYGDGTSASLGVGHLQPQTSGPSSAPR